MVNGSTHTLLQDETVIEANEFPIKSIKLCSSGGAEITRTFPISIFCSQDGPQTAEIVHLPCGLHSVNVSVTSASGNVTVLDHYLSSVVNEDLTHSQILHELETERVRLDDERQLREQSLKFLTTYTDSVAQCKSQGQPEAAQMVSLFDDFVETGVARSAVIAELDAKLDDIDKRITKERERFLKVGRELPVKLVVVFSCDDKVPVEAAELTVTYVVWQVMWHAAYDLHIAMVENTPLPTVKLDFRCSVEQFTGENWENVSLGLTTAGPVPLIYLPEPKKVDIGLIPTHAVQQRAITPQPYNYEPCMLEDDRASLPPLNTVVTPAQTVFPLVSHAIQSSKDLTTPIANGSMFVPSDGAEHHVLVASLSLPAEFMHVVVPSIDNNVYYICEVKNTSEYVLPPGTVKTYINDKHVSSTNIHSTDTPQVLECSIAVDTGVKIIHNRTPDALRSTNIFTGKATTTNTSTMVVHNTRAEPIRKIIVRSSIPLSADPRVTVLLKEPVGLAEIDGGSASVKEGCLVRWSTTGGRKGKQAGLFEWVCDVNPGREVTLKAVWEVRAPRKLRLLK